MKNFKLMLALYALLLTGVVHGFTLQVHNSANYPVTIFCCNDETPGDRDFAEIHSGSRQFKAGETRNFTSEFNHMDNGDDIYCVVMPRINNDISFYRADRYTTGFFGFGVAGTEYLKVQMKNKHGQLYDWVKKVHPVIFEKNSGTIKVVYKQGNQNAQFDNEHLSVG